MPLTLNQGNNISHWLSQSTRRGPDRRAWFGREDVRRIADWGFDHIRLPIDEVQMWDEAGKQETEAFDLMDAALDWADETGMSAIVDLHSLRCHSFTRPDDQRLYTDAAEAAKFADFWRQLSQRLRGRSNTKVAYELMNEPIANDARDWNRVAMGAYQAIRDAEPHRKIVLGSNRWDSVTTFDQLQVPDDEEILLTFHFYNPMLITNHRAPWCVEGKMYSGPVQYPGHPVPLECLAELDEPNRSAVAALNQAYDRCSMVTDLAKPLAVARRTGLPLYCGEFGVVNLAPQHVRQAWYRDFISVLVEHQIGWANWDYKGDFGILDSRGQSTGIAEVLLAVAAGEVPKV
ncbi:MAG: glycoside hydrolase family 5 protein [Chthoniobacteraceae bacterium]|nr:glycoside hydrolase family 5 protein [Chthoniobacteraceae bacterium]